MVQERRLSRSKVPEVREAGGARVGKGGRQRSGSHLLVDCNVTTWSFFLFFSIFSV